VPRAKQRLREVQEVLADREYAIGGFIICGWRIRRRLRG